MGSCEILRKFRKAEARREDVNPPVPLSQFTAKDSPFKLKDDVADALDITTVQVGRAGLLPSEVVGYYHTNKEGIVDKLEIRNIPPVLARAIHNRTVVANLGGYIAKTIGKNEATVGLPHPVNVFKRVELEKGK